ncbi:hypothetical protein L2Y94_07300 [Luteibacter aegosomatis]|uniref:hypothetical protein n=1 Tax=Luteibacter aegosomatis TaxID=2911537 RepID=UPI001FF98C69|nr:hypothetical protein [Luteibacter aegosomatis]UPG87148.1 hypothetical protein L2Y94_07300 [Luteibacter aegosomatis]
MKYSRSIVPFALATCLAAGQAFAQSAPSPSPPTPQPAPASMPGAAGQQDEGAPPFDTVSKGAKLIRRSNLPQDVPALSQLRAHFGEADQDHNGSLDKSEYDAYVHKSSAPSAQH